MGIGVRKQHSLFLIIEFILILSLLLIGCSKESNNQRSISTDSINYLDTLVTRSIVLNQEGNTEEQFKVLDSIYTLGERATALSYMNYADFERGRLSFIENNVDTALHFWLNALSIARKIDSEPNLAELLSNIGTVYFDKGYLKTAIEYFIQARKKMELKDEVYTESYQFTTVNMAVVHIKQNEYELADQVLSAVQLGEWSTVDFLYYLNKALIKFEQGFYEDYSLFIDSAKYLEPEVGEYYTQMLAQVRLEKAIDQNNEDIVSEVLLSIEGSLDRNDLDNIINLHHAFIINNANYSVSPAELDSLTKVCAVEGRINSRLSLYTFLKTYYKKKEIFHEYVNAVEQYDFWKQEFAKMNASSNLIDYYSLLEMDKARFENEQLKSDSQISELKIKNQLYLNYFLVFMVSTIVLIGYLVYLKLKKEKKENEIKLSTLSQNIRAYQENERGLKETISSQEMRLKEVMANVSKIAILRKQLDDFFKELNENEDVEVSPKRLKSAKVDLEAFFSNYTDLALIATKDQKDELNLENPLFHQLTTKEKNVLGLISNNYTSKEIAVLLSRSEKSIEYARRNIRKKLEISADISISDYLNSIKLG